MTPKHAAPGAVPQTPLILDRPLVPGDAVAGVIVLEDGRYILQERDDKPGIFYPGHWGLFGGAVDEAETADQAIVRELDEELGLAFERLELFTTMTFDMSYAGLGVLYRAFFLVHLPEQRLGDIRLGEGRAFAAFTPDELFGGMPIVPYDAFALWQHVNRDLIGERKP